MVPQPLNLHESSSSVSPVQPALDSSILPAQLQLCIFSLDLLMGFFLWLQGLRPCAQPSSGKPCWPEEGKASMSPAFFQGKVPCYGEWTPVGGVEMVPGCCYSPRGRMVCALNSIV